MSYDQIAQALYRVYAKRMGGKELTEDGRLIDMAVWDELCDLERDSWRAVAQQAIAIALALH